MSLKDFTFLKILETYRNVSIFKIKSKKEGIIYILKNIRLQLLNKNEKQKAINEIKLLSSLKHPNIIEFKKAFLDKRSNSLNIISTYGNNGDLRNKILYASKNEMYMEENIIWNVLTQILQGLNYMHKKGIIYTNLNTENIYLTKIRLIKITNFFLNNSSNNNNYDLNQLKVPLYTAPEILNKKPYDYKCDIWSVGCIIYEFASLSSPFKGNDAQSLYNNIMNGTYKQIPDFYSENLKSIINKMLSIEPSKRPSIDELLNSENIKETMAQLTSIYYNWKSGINIHKNNSQIKKIRIPNNKINEKKTTNRHKKNKAMIGLNNVNSSIPLNQNNDNHKDKKIKINNNSDIHILGKTIKNATYRSIFEREKENENNEKTYNCLKNHINFYDDNSNNKIFNREIKNNNKSNIFNNNIINISLNNKSPNNDNIKKRSSSSNIDNINLIKNQNNNINNKIIKHSNSSYKGQLKCKYMNIPIKNIKKNILNSRNKPMTKIYYQNKYFEGLMNKRSNTYQNEMLIFDKIKKKNLFINKLNDENKQINKTQRNENILTESFNSLYKLSNYRLTKKIGTDTNHMLINNFNYIPNISLNNNYKKVIKINMNKGASPQNNRNVKKYLLILTNNNNNRSKKTELLNNKNAKNLLDKRNYSNDALNFNNFNSYYKQIKKPINFNKSKVENEKRILYRNYFKEKPKIEKNASSHVMSIKALNHFKKDNILLTPKELKDKNINNYNINLYNNSQNYLPSYSQLLFNNLMHKK